MPWPIKYEKVDLFVFKSNKLVFVFHFLHYSCLRELYICIYVPICDFSGRKLFQESHFWRIPVMLALERQIQFDVKFHYEETVTCDDTGYWKLKWSERKLTRMCMSLLSLNDTKNSIYLIVSAMPTRNQATVMLYKLLLDSWKPKY